MTALSFDLAAEPTAAARARAALSRLEPPVDEPLMVDLRLLVSEVVTNAVRHTGASGQARVQLVIERHGDRIRVEVHDEGAGFDAPAVPTPRAEGTSGWGLYLVEKLAQRWGTEPAPDAHVWFELATS